MNKSNIIIYILHLCVLLLFLKAFEVGSEEPDVDDLLLMLPAIIAKSAESNPGNSFTPPSNSERPGPTNTGPTTAIDALTKMNGGITVREDGAIIENIDLTGCISIRANNVTVRNSRIDCSSFYAIRMNDGFSGLVVEDVEMMGMTSAAMFGSNFTARRVNVHDSGADAFKPSRNVLIEDSWMHRLGTISDSHSDGVQMVSGGDVTFRRNFVDMPPLDGYTNSQCLIIQTNNGPIDNVLIENNWLNGGGYCIQINERRHGSPQNIRILNNRFGPDCAFGTILVRGENADTLLDGNIFELTGREIGIDEPISSCGNDFE